MKNKYTLSSLTRCAKALAGGMLISSCVYSQDSSAIKTYMEMDLEALLSLQTDGRGDVGGFGRRLSENNAKSLIHGYVTNEFHTYESGKASTFDNHYYNVFVGSNIGENIFAEIQLEYEHGGEDITARYAQVDYKFSDALIIRTGKFLTPINTFNEYLYPEYINKAISRPWINREITPTAWGEVGVQVRGSVKPLKSLQVFYSAFLVNGLEGTDGDGIRDLRNNFRDKNNGEKSYGGRLGAKISGLEFGAGVYNGKYTTDGKKNLFIGAFDAAYSTQRLTIWSEFNMANQESGDSVLNKMGGSLLIAYSVFERIEPVVRVDFIQLGTSVKEDDRSRLYAGINYKLANTMTVRAGYEFITDEGTDANDNTFSIQLALGF